MTNAGPDSPIIKVDASQLELRRLRPQDVPQVMEIESVSFGNHHWADESFYNEMNNQIGRYYALVSADTPLTNNDGNPQQRLLGYCGFWFIVDEAHVTTVAISPEYRGNALGELLLMQALERSYSTSIHWMTLEVRVSNYSAQNLYYKYGFLSMGTRPKYYQDNQEDALIMTTPDIASEEYRKLFRERKEALKMRLGGFPKGFGL